MWSPDRNRCVCTCVDPSSVRGCVVSAGRGWGVERALPSYLNMCKFSSSKTDGIHLLPTFVLVSFISVTGGSSQYPGFNSQFIFPNLLRIAEASQLLCGLHFSSPPDLVDRAGMVWRHHLIKVFHHIIGHFVVANGFEVFSGTFDFMEAMMNRPQVKPAPKDIGRNDPCPCGSGKKYKNCCMNVAV